MNPRLLISISASIAMLFDSVYLLAGERVIWNKTPIPVQLTVNQERLIHFPSDIRFWLPDTLKTKISVLAADGVLYVQSKSPFTKTRIRVQALDTQQLYLLDISSHNAGNHSDALIIMHKTVVTNSVTPTPTETAPIDWPVRLTRFAAQTLYAPERLRPVDVNIQRISIDTATAIPLFRGIDIEAKPLGAWRGGDLFVTAIILRNLSQHTLHLTLSHSQENTIELPNKTVSLTTDLRGHWLTVTAQHTELKPAGHDEDRTSLYLISHRRLSESLMTFQQGGQ